MLRPSEWCNGEFFTARVQPPPLGEEHLVARLLDRSADGDFGRSIADQTQTTVHPSAIPIPLHQRVGVVPLTTQGTQLTSRRISKIGAAEVSFIRNSCNNSGRRSTT